MDQLDADILRRTQFPSSLMEERPTYYSIAKSMKQNPSTVRNRISKMKESGVLKDIVAIPDPGILNMKRIAVLLSCDYKTSEAIISEMGRFRSLMGIHRAVHSTIGLIMEFMYREEEELESDLKALKEISETVQIMMKVDFAPRCSVKDGKRYMNILDRIIRDPMAGIDEISKDIGINRKTTAKRIRELTHERAFYFEPALSSYMNSYGMLFILTIPVPDEQKEIMKTMMTGIMGESFLLMKDQFSGMLTFLGHTQNMHEMNLVRESLKEKLGTDELEPIVAFDSTWQYSLSMQNGIREIMGLGKEISELPQDL
ncbi:MAG: hypothetical protein M1414_03330 [Candidatus Thermoplasmatota archaeon]|jgi:DNA-binding Lrp family transcriptional regulator|nr:hypothetical protein [Candidatus Thermoplasmatota archaeon]MCL5987921.1 hypothetical protein [Candidatus Thermoplasmatota archaeon]